MKILAVISQKGGAGKTTLALHLAVAAEVDGHSAAVIDLDPQASAAAWGDSREADAPVVVSSQASRLPQVLNAARDNSADLCVIDTAPHSEGPALAAIRAADLVLIPCRPAILDLRSIGSTVDLVRIAQKMACVVLNAVPSRGSLPDEAREAVSSYDIPVAPGSMGQRVAYVHSLTAGLTAQEFEPHGKAAEEIQQLYMYTRKQIGL